MYWKMENFCRMRFDKNWRNITVQVLKNLLQSVVVKMEYLIIFTASASYIKIQVKILKNLFYIAGDRNWVRQDRWVHRLDRSIGQPPLFFTDSPLKPPNYPRPLSRQSPNILVFDKKPLIIGFFSEPHNINIVHP